MLSDRAGLDPALALHRFVSAEELDAQLAADVARALAGTIEARGSAVLAVSGGRTPAAMFARLAQAPLQWNRISVTLVDDRWLPADHADSNARLVRQHLLQGPAAAARWVGLVGEGGHAATGLASSRAVLASLSQPFDVVLLGMGNDGHTASLFPCAAETAAALDPDCPDRLAVVHPASAPYERISLTLPVLAAARNLWLHLTGDEKWQVLVNALASNPPNLPIARVFAAARGDKRVYWSPAHA